MERLIRGFKDILPSEANFWRYVIKTAVDLFRDFGYGEIYTPIVERSSLFAKSIGEETDVVEKEMYTFTDRKGDLLTLRPEATASIVRAFVQHKLYALSSITKLYSFGPMFRYERPQKGRYRQFYQIDAEVFGLEFSHADAEVIFILYSLLVKLSVHNATVYLNSLGCSVCRPSFESYLVEEITAVSANLCPDCVRRKVVNPLRILDCKTKSCRKVLGNLKGTIDFLCYDCRKHFDEVAEFLCQLEVPFNLDRNLVRGLDYYNRTVFEIRHSNLGSQNAVAGGGRYDKLVHILGGPKTPAVGFAIGLNRLMEVINLNSDIVSSDPYLFIAVLGEKAMKLAFQWQMRLNHKGIKTILGEFNRSLKAQMKQANYANVSYTLILGEREINEGEAVFRCMRTGVQSKISIDTILFEVKAKFYG